MRPSPSLLSCPRRRAWSNLLAGEIFSLTRVTRIFQKNVFTKTAPAGAAGARARFLLRARHRRRSGFRLGRKGTTWGFRPEAWLVRPAHAPQSAVAEMGRRRSLPVSGLLFTGNRSTLPCPPLNAQGAARLGLRRQQDLAAGGRQV